MNDDTYYAMRDDRLLRYPQARRLDQSRWIAIRATPEYVSSYPGQVAVLTAATLFSRMARRIALDIPSVRIVEPLPWANEELDLFAIQQMRVGDPRGEFCVRAADNPDYVLQLGGSGAQFVTHGTGWRAYNGPNPSPLGDDRSANPVGAALAVVARAAHLSVHGFEAPPTSIGLNALNWSHDISRGPPQEMPPTPNLGSLWTIGTGSVGTAILYFLSLATRRFSTALFDGDTVKRENITRSPIFTDADINYSKVEVTAAYLKRCGVADVRTEAAALHESSIWLQRRAGSPDLVIATANEHSVRHSIEALFPPLQIYGTTGKNWQATVIRHIPMREPCSCCLFPEAIFTPTTCATDQEIAKSSHTQIDASLPFLSFAAGLMAAAEVLKLQLPGYPFTPNRAILTTRPGPRLVAAGTTRRGGCMCLARSQSVHLKMIEGSRYSALSGYN